jgi:hypothetical protein
MGIKDIEDLRKDAIKTLEKLQKSSITIEEAGVTGKLYESIMASVKLQLEVCKMVGREPRIPFLGNYNDGKIITVTKKLTHDKNK